jgi:poly-gamma-glutamate capsule biosynthesis protein CapA/YwtB (metallophosphatase superfamily)
MRSFQSKLELVFLAGVLLLFSGCAKKSVTADNIQTNKLAEDVVKSDSVEKKPVKILFVGDMMFDRYIRQATEKHGGDYNYIFSDIKSDLEQYDLVVGNLEGPITDKQSVSVGTAMDEKRNLVFSFDPAVAGALAENNIGLVSLGNNHILNQGEGGLAETKKYLDEAGVKYFGDTGNNNSEFQIREIRGVKIGFVNYNYSIAGSFKKAIGDIGNIRNSVDFVVVCPHWGTEYKTGKPGQSIQEMARKFIDAGADLVIGTHPHVVEASETYKGKRIYYSLGNFIFDQYFSSGTMRGLAVAVEINPADGSMNFQEIPVAMERNGKTEFEK